MELMTEHGVSLPPEMHGLTDEQITELKLKDEWSEKYEPSGGCSINKLVYIFNKKYIFLSIVYSC